MNASLERKMSHKPTKARKTKAPLRRLPGDSVAGAAVPGKPAGIVHEKCDAAIKEEFRRRIKAEERIRVLESLLNEARGYVPPMTSLLKRIERELYGTQ